MAGREESALSRTALLLTQTASRIDPKKRKEAGGLVCCNRLAAPRFPAARRVPPIYNSDRTGESERRWRRAFLADVNTGKFANSNVVDVTSQGNATGVATAGGAGAGSPGCGGPAARGRPNVAVAIEPGCY